MTITDNAIIASLASDIDPLALRRRRSVEDFEASYVEVDLGQESLVEAIATEGNQGNENRVTMYQVSYRRNATEEWSYVRNEGDSRLEKFEFSRRMLF